MYLNIQDIAEFLTDDIDIPRLQREINMIPDYFSLINSQVDDSGLRNPPEPTEYGQLSGLFRPFPTSFQADPTGNHTGSWKQYSGRISPYPETMETNS